MSTFYSPEGNPEIWNTKPKGYFTEKQWLAAHPVVESPEDFKVLRQHTYESEADDFFRQAQFYEAEAKGLYLLGEEDAGDAADEKSQEFYQLYAAKKLEIRKLYPDPEGA